MSVVAITTTFSVSQMSCSDYLDVVPPEQAELPDAVRDYDSTLKFMFSCYAGMAVPFDYSGIEAAADEFVLPPLWREGMHNILYGLNTPLSVQDDRWSNKYYAYIGQCHLFLSQLPNAKGVTEEQKKVFEAETKFLRAYYHMQTLFLYGPCPIVDKFYPSTTPRNEYPGRYHFDYVVDWIAREYDEVAKVLPASRTAEEWGRATSTMAKALKARLFVYAASPLWNGNFPFPEWKNKNFETPGYGKDLVSLTYDANKWERAKVACREAIDWATGQGGHSLYTDENYYKTQTGVQLPYVPGVNASTTEGEAFLKKVMLMRYLVTTRVTEGNREIIWGSASQGNFIWGSIPHYVLLRNNGTTFGYWSGVSPILNTSIEYFYTKNGKRPAHDSSFTSRLDWYKSASISGTGRDGIINLNVNREPRFYAWFAFDGGDYGNRLNNGNPLLMELRNAEKQGFNRDKYNRDNNVTGYFSQKFLPPAAFMAPSGGTGGFDSKPRPLIRLAELYLNLAECEAALGNATGTFDNLNIVRKRAGVPELTAANSSEQSLMEWVRNERFIELWGEGHRYYDVRRWVIARETMASGARKGLNAYGIKNPTFEQFNTVVPVEQDFKWQDKMYLHPVGKNEAYKNAKLLQSPRY